MNRNIYVTKIKTLLNILKGEIKDSGKLIITPHIGWASVEARTRCVDEAYKNIEAFLKFRVRAYMTDSS